ncbi:hypothetical protein ACN38_g9577 [Penicillium nordicum]|uniref:Uncharacterized protein n=1 Tax=Penicillium nordicum TaxID=229535 RepID=A0A0M8NUC1_9EURO|nr:hypothetical protein ACN38_g9577 [Penicillium nordicum]
MSQLNFSKYVFQSYMQGRNPTAIIPTKKQTLLQQNEDHVDFLSRPGDCHLHPRCTQPCSARPRATATYKSQRSHLQLEPANNLPPLFFSQRLKHKHRHQMLCLLVNWNAWKQDL